MIRINQTYIQRSCLLTQVVSLWETSKTNDCSKIYSSDFKTYDDILLSNIYKKSPKIYILLCLSFNHKVACLLSTWRCPRRKLLPLELSLENHKSFIIQFMEESTPIPPTAQHQVIQNGCLATCQQLVESHRFGLVSQLGVPLVCTFHFRWAKWCSLTCHHRSQEQK